MLLKTIEVGWSSGLILLRVKPLTQNHYAVSLGMAEALKLAHEIETIVADQLTRFTTGGVLGDKPVAIWKVGNASYITVCGDGKSYTVALTAAECNEVVRRLRNAAKVLA